MSIFKGKAVWKIMLCVPDAEYEPFKPDLKEKDEFVEALQNSIWPKTNAETFLNLLEEGGKEYLEMKHGPRQETCLHRYVNTFNWTYKSRNVV